MEMPLVEALSDFNGLPYRQFYGYDFAYESWAMEDVWNMFYLAFSIIYASSGLHTWGVWWKVIRGKIDLSDMKFLRR
jgi:hypothetical protein